MSSNKKIHNRLNELFDEIKQTEQPNAQSQKKVKRTPVSSNEPPKQPHHTGSLSPVTQRLRQNVTVDAVGSQSTMSFPFQAGNTWNLLELYQDETRQFHEDDESLVRQVADQLGLALQNAQLFQQTEQQKNSLEILNQMGRELATQLNIEQVVETAYKFISQLMDTSSFFIALINNQNGTLTFPLVTVNKKRIEYPERKIGSGLTDYVLRTQKPQLLNGDVTAQMQALGIAFVPLGNTNPAVSWLGAPLIIGNKTLGAIVAQSTQIPYLYTEQHRDLLVAVASQTAIALQNAQLFQQTEEQKNSLEILNEMSRDLTSLRSIPEIAESLHKYTSRLMNGENFFISLHNPISNAIDAVYLVVKSEKQPPITLKMSGMTGWVFTNKKPLLLNGDVDAQAESLGIEKLSLYAEEAAPASWLGVPLLLGAEILGAMVVQSENPGVIFMERERDLLMAIASQASISIENARLFAETQKRASELATLNEIVRVVSQQIELKQVLDAAYQQIRKLVSVDAFFVAFYDEKADVVSFPIVIDEGKYYEETDTPLNQNNYTGKTLLSGKVLHVELTPEEAAAAAEKVDGAIGNAQKLSGSLLYIPLNLGQKTIGCLSVQSYNLYAYKPEDVALLENVANQLTIAIQNARLFENTRKSAQQMAAVAEVTSGISTILDLQGLLEKSVHLTQRLFGLYHAHVFILAEDGRTLSVKACGWPENSEQEGTHGSRDIDINAKISIVARAARTKKAIILNDVHSDPTWLPNAFLPDVQSEMAIPLMTADQVLGVLNVHADRLNFFTDADIDIMTTLAAQIGAATHNALLFNETQRYAEEMTLLNAVATQASSSLDLQKSLTGIVGQMTAALSLADVGVALVEPGGKLRVIAEYLADANDISSVGTELSLDDPLLQTIIASHQSVTVTEVPNKPLPPGIKRITDARKTQTMTIFPLLAQNTVIGTLALHIAQPGRELNPDEMRLVETIISQVSIAVQNARLYEREQYRRRVSDALSEMARIASSTLNLSEVVHRLLGQVPRLITFRTASIQMIGADGKRQQIGGISLDQNRQTSIHSPSDVFLRSITEDPLMNEVYTRQEPVFITDTRADPRWERLLETEHIRSWLCAPLITGENVFGFILFEADEPDVYNAESADLAKSISTQIAAAIQNARLFEQTQRNEESFRNLVENAPEAIIGINAVTGLFIEPNGNAIKLYGLPREELLKVGLDEMSPAFQPDGRLSSVITMEKIGDALAGETPIFEFMQKNAQGQLIPCEIHLSRLSSDEPLVRATVVDITERKKAQDTLRQNEALMRTIVDATPDWILVKDRDHRVTMMNQAYANRMGRPMAELLGKNDIDLGYPEEAVRAFWADDDEVLRDGHPKIIPEEKKVAGDEVTYVSTIKVPLFDQNNQPTSILVFVHDITNIKQSEEALRRNDEALRRQNEYLATAAEVSRLISSTLDLPTLFERTANLIQSRFGYYHVAIFTTDESGLTATLREGTGEAGRIMKEQKHSLPIGAKSVIGNVTANSGTLLVNNTAIDPIHRPNPLLPETRAEAGIALKIGSRVIGALDIQARAIDAFHSDDIAVLESLADQIAVAIDNARSYELAQKAADELREADRIKSQFLANMSHELRTPLNSIIGFSRVIMKGIDGPVTEQQHQDLSAIYASGQHLLGLINDILDLSKIEAGKMELTVEEMNITDTINSVLSTALGLLKDKPVKLKQESEPNLPTIRADPMRLRQVLLNLISNASKFTTEGSITVSAAPHTSDNGQKEVMISVTDTGPGISPEGQKKLFLAFSQVDSSATRATGGTGLGLSICRLLVDMHGGRIGVHSVEGQGSTFHFTIPIFHQPIVESAEGEGKVILCIDDDPLVINLYERYLKPKGFQVVAVTNPANAKESIKRFKPYAVTLDIMMPDIDGWSVLEAIKADPETRNTPVIICSITEEDEKGFSLGAADYLVKPIGEEDLMTALNRINGNGGITEVLIIDDSPDDLRLMGKIISEHSQFHPILAEGGENGWEILKTERPSAVILDLFMPDLDGFAILERLRTTPELRDIPVLVVSGVDLSPEQKSQLDNLGKHLLQKGMLSEQELFQSLEKALNRLEVKTKQE